jgi:carboxypeptidase C (cathepsin A)
MNFVVRYSEHINEDLARNWSSFNFGEEGLNCTAEELQSEINSCLNEERPLYISGMELWGDELRSATIKELYSNYWVLVDMRQRGLSCNLLNADTVEEAIEIVNDPEFAIDFGSELMVNCSAAKIVFSKNNVHVLCV